MSIKNRYEIMMYLACTDANPNGDPDMGNLARTDPDTSIGYITDAAIKRRVRDYVGIAYAGQPGMDIFVRSGTNLNAAIAEAKEAAGVTLKDVSKEAIDKSRRAACGKFFDVRTFGGVLSTGPNAGQVQGPVQIAFARSLDPIDPQDIAVTRCASSDKVDGAQTAAEYRSAQEAAKEDKLRTIGRKQFIPFGLYEIRGFVSANLAAQTGFDDSDFAALCEALANMYDTLRSASKGQMSVVSPVIIFRHDGDTAQPEEVQVRQAMLGRAPAHKLFETVECRKKAGVETPRSYRDYECQINFDRLPAGITVGFMPAFGSGIVWGKLPDGEDWVTLA